MPINQAPADHPAFPGQAKTGLLDVFFKAYFPHEDQGMDFYDWVDNVYDPEAMLAEFRSQGWADRLIDSVLRRE